MGFLASPKFLSSHLCVLGFELAECFNVVLSCFGCILRLWREANQLGFQKQIVLLLVLVVYFWGF